MIRNLCFLIGLMVVLLHSPATLARQNRDSLTTQIDSIKVLKFNADSVKKYFKASDTLVAYQLNKVEEYTVSFNKINADLKRGFKTAYIENLLPESDSVISIAKNNLSRLGNHASLKIVYNIKSILKQQQDQLSKWQEKLSEYNVQLNKTKDQINSAKGDEKLLIMPSDSLLFLEYIKKLKPLGEKVSLADSNVLVQLRRLGILQNEVSSNYLTVSDLLNEADYQIGSFSNLIFDNEFGYLWNKDSSSTFKPRAFRAVVERSVRESALLIRFYSRSNWLSRFIVLGIALLFFFIMRRNLMRIKRQSESTELIFVKTKHIARHLFLSTVVFSLLIIPFIYNAAPQGFTQSLWGLQIIALGILIRKKLDRLAGLQWFILILLFFLTSFSNLLIEMTYTERWIQLFVSLVSLGLGFWLYFSKNKNYFSGAGFFNALLILFIGMNMLAFLANIFGRVIMAKILNTGASYGMIEAINLLIFVEIIIDAIVLSMEASKKSSRLTAYFQYKGMEKQMRKILGVLAAVFWLIIFTQNLHVFEGIADLLSAFFSREFSLGNINFTFGSLLVFILVVWLSNFLSQMVSFIFGDHDTEGPLKSRLGSTILLVRLAIFSAGFLLAFAASGIPLDKIAIVIGALGVGIGFGLQNIVNNLVSGVILAFEKPIQIGDIIEVGTRSGTVKEVGIRSSKLTTFDGSEVIIPNGDMLSQHLINWTGNNVNRRIVLGIGVAYGSDLGEVQRLIRAVLDQHEDVYALPEPAILAQNLGDSAVEINVYFWTEMSKWFALRADILKLIYEALNEAKISIPFPQRDLHLKSVDPGIEAGWNKK